MRDIQLEITQKFITAIEAGVSNTGSWVRPWQRLATEGAAVNAKTGKEYRGMNALILSLSGCQHWAGYGQWAEKGCQVRKGEKGTAILAPLLKKDNKTGENVLFGFRGVSVFSSEQVDGWVEPVAPTTRTVEPVAAAVALIDNSGASIQHGGDSAHYVPSMDYIQLPHMTAFSSPEGYYGTALHELTHWTGHKSRLDRELNTGRFGDEAYAFEELVAELSSAFLCATTGVHMGYMDNHARYLAGWLRVLKNDSKALMTAAAQAQKAHDYLVEKEKAAIQKVA
jgi:antirestriction protein ArdC